MLSIITIPGNMQNMERLGQKSKEIVLSLESKELWCELQNWIYSLNGTVNSMFSYRLLLPGNAAPPSFEHLKLSGCSGCFSSTYLHIAAHLVVTLTHFCMQRWRLTLADLYNVSYWKNICITLYSLTEGRVAAQVTQNLCILLLFLKQKYLSINALLILPSKSSHVY